MGVFFVEKNCVFRCGRPKKIRKLDKNLGGKPDFGIAHLSTPIFLDKYRFFQASESQILAPPICPPRLFSRKKAFSRLRKAAFWHSLSVDPSFSQEIKHFPGCGKPLFATVYLLTPARTMLVPRAGALLENSENQHRIWIHG